MYRKLMWCYVLVLTLLDLSLNSKLTAQGKSHGVTVHESLVEGITLQEWGSESGAEGGGGGGAGAGSGRALPPGSLRAEPAALALGRAALGAARAATVTLTNTANTTMHLASVAGTTPDFHASFFDSKTLACGANTSFSVVYLGRREGPVAAHLYIHTSLGVHKYPVSAVGVASEWALWPLVDVRVPHNATLRPLLTMHNPTSHPVQVQEIYSSAAWLGLQLPGGASAAPRALWSVPPHSARALVRLRIAAPPGAALDARTAYIRIKANTTGGALVVGVQARAAPAGLHARPLQLRAGTRGARDPPYTFEIELGNSDAAARGVAAAVWGARCRAAPHHPPAPPPAPRANGAAATANGAGPDGARLAVLRAQLDPHQEPAPAAHFTLDFAKLWSSGATEAEEEGAEGAEGGAGGGERWCAGWAALGGAALPYSVRLLPGTLRLPAQLHFVTSNEEECMKPQDLTARNEFEQPIQIVNIEYPPELLKYFDVGEFAPVSLRAGEEAVLARLRLRTPPAAAPRDALDAPDALDALDTLDARVTVLTNLTHTRYAVPVQVYSGKLDIEWLWPNATADTLPLGTLATSSTRRVVARLRNPAPARACVTCGAALPGATLALAPHHHHCLPPGGEVEAVLTVVAPARAGAVRGALWLHTAHAQHRVAVTLHARAGHLRAALAPLPPGARGEGEAEGEGDEDDDEGEDQEDHAPFAGGRGWALVADSSMELRMRLARVAPAHPDPALLYTEPAEEAARWLGPGRSALGRVQYAAERACAGRCYTGRALGAAAAAAAAAWRAAPLAADLALLAERRNLFLQEVAHGALRNVSLFLDTNEMVRIPVSGWVRLTWPRLSAPGAGWAGLAGVAAGGGAGGAGGAGGGGGAARWLRVRNPSRTHSLALHALIAPAMPLPDGVLVDSPQCASGECEYAAGVFSLAEWRAPRGGVAAWGERGAGEGGAGGAGGGGEGGALPALLLAPRARLELRVWFAPPAPRLYHAYLYLRNNLTMVEAIRLAGRGAVPRFELAGRAPGAAPLLLQVSDCKEGSECDETVGEGEEDGEGDEEGGRWVVRRTVVARNTGAVPLRLRAWRVAGQPCRARGFRLTPCAPLALAPNESRALTLAFRADCGLARVPAALTLRADSGPAAFRLLGAVPARLLPACAAALPRPPWEPALRGAGLLLALLALAAVLCAAAADAERTLRRARDQRAHHAPRAPLDLRALAREPPAPAPAQPPRRRRPRRAAPPADPPGDPHAERRAFERWRAEVLRRDAPRADDDDERSSEDADAPPEPRAPPAPASPDAPPDGSDTEPDTEERPRSSGDDDAASTGTDCSSPPDDADDADDREPDPPSPLSSDRTPPLKLRPRTDAPPAEGARGAGATRPRRESSPPPRRTEPPARARAAPGKHHTRKDKPSKRRGERAAPTPARPSPPHAEPRGATGAGGGPSAAGGAGAAAGGALRWGASWSSVVAAPARREAAPAAPARPAADHSLFYFNDAAHSLRAQPAPPAPAHHAPTASDYAWRGPDRSAFNPSPHDYLVSEEPNNVSNNAYGTIGSPWTPGGDEANAGAWMWGAALRPPPGFGPPPVRPAPPARPPLRTFDPFHSLASIWAPAAFDWRADPRDPRDPPAQGN